MSHSIRTRLTLLVALVFVAALVCILTAGAFAFYLAVTGDTDAVLDIETGRAAALFDSEYRAILTLNAAGRDTLVKEFSGDLEETYEGTRRFAVFILKTDGGPQLFEGGVPEDYDAGPDHAFSSEEDHYYDRFENALYRIQVSRHDWGVLTIGLESPILSEVAAQLGSILIVVIPVTLILVLAGGRFLARRAMKPVLTAAMSAENITVTNLSDRLPDYTGQDEFGALVSTFNGMIERLETGVRRMRQFTQDAAHELRSPLAILRGELELSYQHEPLPDEVRDSLRKALDRTIAMSAMVENLMLLARSDAGRFEFKPSRILFDVLVRDLIEDINILAEPRRIAVHLERCDAASCMGDEALLRRLLLNLADNALKYTPEGRITVRLTQNDAYLTFSIRDTGVGIPENDLPHLFDRFYRVDSSRNRDSGGSGLGLAICRWIAGVHGGDIKIESVVSRGTTVTLTLPLASSSEV